jgi:hypothetical protein
VRVRVVFNEGVQTFHYRDLFLKLYEKLKGHRMRNGFLKRLTEMIKDGMKKAE